MTFMTQYLHVGGQRIEFKRALAFAARYLANEGGLWAYPAYDSYPGHPGSDVGRADLLAVSLLHAHQRPVATYYSLEALLPVLNARLADPALSGTLADAKQPTVEALARLFGILDDYKTHQVSLTKLSKVLHRKRPELIPLYDENIRVCYMRNGNIPRAKDRSWKDFSMLLLPAIRHDLVNQMDLWLEIAALASGPAITPLRAMDIIGWHLGGQKPEDEMGQGPSDWDNSPAATST
jgi:hypothetical protein